MKKASTVFKKFKGFFLAFVVVALAFLAVGLGTLGSFYSAGAAYELEVKKASDSAKPSVVFKLPSSYPGSDETLRIVDVYLNVAIIYAEEGTPAQLTLQRSTTNENWDTLVSSSYKFDVTLENFFTPEPELNEEGKVVEKVPTPHATDVFFRYVAPFTDLNYWSSWTTMSSRYWGISATGGANILINEVVFIGEVDGERVVIPNVEVLSAAYGENEKPEEARLRAEALLDAQPKKVPALDQPAYARFTKAEIATLMTIAEMRRGNIYATDENTASPSAVDTYYADRIYGALGTDFIALGTAIFGMNPFGLRFLPMLAAFGALVVFSRFASRLFKSEKAGFVFALLFALSCITLSLAHLGTPLMIGVFFFACALDLVHRFYAKGIKKANLVSVLPLLCAGLFGAAAICTHGAFIIPMIGVVVLFILGLVRLKQAKEYQIEKILEEPKEAPASVAETQEGAEVPETRELRAAKVLRDHKFKKNAAILLFGAGLVVGTFLLALIGMLPAYYAYLKIYDNPAAPALNVFVLAWRTFANGFVGGNYYGTTTWSFFYTFLRSETSFAAATGTGSVLGFSVNWIAMLAALVAVVYAIVRIAMLFVKKADSKTMRITLRRTLIPLCGIVLSLIASAFAPAGIMFVLLAWLFAFVLAAGFFGGECKCKAAKAVNIAGVILLVAVFALMLVFVLGIPLDASILAKIFG